MRKFKVTDIISFLILLITIISVNQWSDFRFFFNDNSSILPVYFSMLLLMVLGNNYYFKYRESKDLMVLILYTAWVIICLIRGGFVAENRAEWIQLINNSFALLLPIIAFSTVSPVFVQNILSTWFKLIIPIYIIFILFFMEIGVSGFMLYPFTILLIGFSAIPNKWKIISMICLFIILLTLDARSHVIKYSFAFLIGMMYFSKKLITQKRLNYLRYTFLILPLIFVVLGLNNIFNVFDMNSYIKSNYEVKSSIRGEDKSNLIEDSRTFLYYEVINSAIENNYVLFGRTPARGNDTEVFASIAKSKFTSGKAERPANEAAILNTFTWTGIVGVVLYFLVFFKASSLAINKSNNYYSKLFGLYISFRWIYMWVEDFQRVDIMNLTLWIIIIMCFSNSFRNMTDSEFRVWIKGIFDYRFRFQYIYNKQNLTQKG